jgi:RHH-type rel operon transcriptional repressor/antitoxin RelB
MMATSVRLATEIEQRLDRLAATTGRTKAYYLREIIERGIEDMEDIYIAQKVLEDVRARCETTRSLEEVGKRLVLAD